MTAKVFYSKLFRFTCMRLFWWSHQQANFLRKLHTVPLHILTRWNKITKWATSVFSVPFIIKIQTLAIVSRVLVNLRWGRDEAWPHLETDPPSNTAHALLLSARARLIHLSSVLHHVFSISSTRLLSCSWPQVNPGFIRASVALT